jgi:hypothetical protein
MRQRAWDLVLGVAVIGACGNGASPGAGSSPPLATVVRTDPASAGECPFGGSVVSAGTDANQNQVLDDSEVRVRTVLCNAMPAQQPPIVVRLVAEPGGVHCAKGGTAVQSGPDRNGNGQLDDDEVAHTDYVCGDALLTRIAAEPAGPRCIAGGVAFLTGLDRDGDGKLADAEVLHTELSCGDILSRDVSITSGADAQALAGIRVINGDLAIDASSSLGPPEVVLPRLEHVDGQLVLSPNMHLVRIAMPQLLEIEGPMAVQGNEVLITIDLPRLSRVGGLLITGNPALPDLRGLGSLQMVDGGISMQGNAALASAAIPGFRTGVITGTIDVRDNPALAALEIDTLTTRNPIIISRNGIATLNVGGRGQLGDSLGAITIDGNPQLATARLFDNHIDGVSLTGNASLTTLDVTADRILGSLTVSGNPALGSVLLGRTPLGNGIDIDGSLLLSGPIALLGTSEVAVRGNVTLDGTRLVDLLPGQPFTMVGGTVRLANNPRLEDALFDPPVGGGVELSSNPVLHSVAFRLSGGRITDHVLHGKVTISQNPALAVAQFLGGITQITGTLLIANNQRFVDMSTQELREVDGDVQIGLNDTLDHLTFDQLRVVRGNIIILENHALPAIVLPVFDGVASFIEISGNLRLHDLQLPAIEVADMLVESNPVLPACAVDALFARIAGDHLQFGNDDDAVCTSP